MNKSEFIEELAASMGQTRTLTEAVINAMFRKIYGHVRKGEKVQFSGFGTFSARKRKAHMGVNPKTMQKMSIPSTLTIKFVAGDAFKNSVRK